MGASACADRIIINCSSLPMKRDVHISGVVDLVVILVVCLHDLNLPNHFTIDVATQLFTISRSIHVLGL